MFKKLLVAILLVFSFTVTAVFAGNVEQAYVGTYFNKQGVTMTLYWFPASIQRNSDGTVYAITHAVFADKPSMYFAEDVNCSKWISTSMRIWKDTKGALKHDPLPPMTSIIPGTAAESIAKILCGTSV